MTVDPNPAPRLTRLELQGFKSFANRTVFLFDQGITAVIGPNGSGKSNIADAVRWVLGEQSHTLLRSKKTEDVIFAGGQGRSPVGLAEVSVTFDNRDGWLPTDFSEVTVTRRATRAGENLFLINGKKVRLKDVHHLTASLGHSYTVVGQGMVDAALSQRADERRGLFEHAADLTGLRLRAQEAERNLTDAEGNATRIGDLLAESEPRLRSLERAARQAREWKGTHDRLRSLQLAHFQHLLITSQAALADAEARAAAGEDGLGEARGEVQRLAGLLTESRRSLDELTHDLATRSTHLVATEEQQRRISHEHDLTLERLSALNRRREDMSETEQAVQEQATAVAAEMTALEAEIASSQESLLAARSELTTREEALIEARGHRLSIEKRSSELNLEISSLERQLSDIGRRQALLAQQEASETADESRELERSADRDRRILRLKNEEDNLTAQDTAAASELTELGKQLAESLEAAAQTGHQIEVLRLQLNEADRELSAANGRLETLRNIHASGAGLFAGARRVMQGAAKGELTGVRGTVAELIVTPARYESAIEVTLGGRLQDIVVDRWADAEQAIELLKRESAGRATFQPIETVRSNRPESPVAKGTSGVEGIAADLVESDPSVKAIVTALLGRTLVVTDLAVTRQLLKSLPGGWSVVTLSGEIARSGGSVTGGAAVKETGTLARERELRELPATIEAMQQKRNAIAGQLQMEDDSSKVLASRRMEIEGERASLIATRREWQAQIKRLQVWQEEQQREAQSIAKRTVSRQRSLEEISSARVQAAAEEQEASRQRAALTAEHEAILAALAERATDLDSGNESVQTVGREVAALEERAQANNRRMATLRAQAQGLESELRARSERGASLLGEIKATEAQRDRLAVELVELNHQLEMLRVDYRPIEAKVRETEELVGSTESRLESARESLLEAERTKGQAGLGVERARSEVSTVHQRIMDDLEIEEPGEILAIALTEEVDLADAEREIYRLKERLRRVGFIGDEALEQYEQEVERHQFLSTQLEDVTVTIAKLRSLLDELRGEMERRFEETFSKVATAFSHHFTTMFGGGTAQLVLAGNDSENGGVEIVAQPPGKRLQSLALLSGGERALTAAALLFAILEVNPTPFTLLDEVDAALDEANIVRFRDGLQALAARSQAIIITHNRGTIEAADTLYGVSMREDGVSQVLSIRLDERADQATAG